MRQASKRIPESAEKNGPGYSQSHTSASFSGREDPHCAGSQRDQSVVERRHPPNRPNS